MYSILFKNIYSPNERECEISHLVQDEFQFMKKLNMHLHLRKNTAIKVIFMRDVFPSVSETEIVSAANLITETYYQEPKWWLGREQTLLVPEQEAEPIVFLNKNA